jgi:hypothetical protein
VTLGTISLLPVIQQRLTEAKVVPGVARIAQLPIATCVEKSLRSSFGAKTNMSNTTDSERIRVEVEEGNIVDVCCWETNQTNDIPVA